jgi:hypothetical protein
MSEVKIMTRLGTGLAGVQIPADAIYFSLLRNVQTSTGIHPAGLLSGYWTSPAGKQAKF